MRKHSPLVLLLTLALASTAFASGTERPSMPTNPSSNSSDMNPNGEPLTPRQQAEREYGIAYDEVAKAKEEAAAGKAKSAEKHFKRGLDHANEAVTLDSTYHEAWNLVGFASRRTGDYPHSLAAYRTALRLKPDFAQAREYYGEALLETGDVAGAKAQLAILTKAGQKEQAALLAAAIDKQAVEKNAGARSDTSATTGSR